MISTEELQSLVGCLGTTLSPLESDALRLYLEGSSYEAMAAELGCDTKTIDNALQRVKRKILNHQRERQVLRRRHRLRWLCAGVAQLAEHLICNQVAAGSSPASGFSRGMRSPASIRSGKWFAGGESGQTQRGS